MPTYTVHQPPQRDSGPVSGPERFVFVRDGFRFWAFLLPPLWLLLHRLWLALVIYVALTVAMTAAFAFAGIPPWADAVASLLLGLLLGLEAGTVQRWTYARSKWAQVGYIVAEDEELAERRFFSQWVAREPATESALPPRTLPATAAPLPRRAAPDVIGLFPQPGTPR